ncbi:MAG: 4-(cytidine 5'-diphospho)-2-C-methyl-D-erythritol kinase [Planctomycetota bacterium]
MRLRRHSNQLYVATPAKLNLFLELLGKRDDGYHQIETVMTTVSLFDELRFTPTDDGQISMSVRLVGVGVDRREQDVIPNNQRNLVVQALTLLLNDAAERGVEVDRPGMQVELNKRIPSAAGLGGASSNAAGALIAGNLLWSLGLRREQLAELAAQLGSDIPFFIYGGMAVCEGRGEIISPVDHRLGPIDVVIVKPGIALSTRDVFSQVDLTDDPVSRVPLTDAVRCGDRIDLGRQMMNRMESAAGKLTGEVSAIGQQFETIGCLGHQMSGSGSSYFGVFRNRNSAQRAARKLQARMPSARVFYARSESGAYGNQLPAGPTVLAEA